MTPERDVIHHALTAHFAEEEDWRDASGEALEALAVLAGREQELRRVHAERMANVRQKNTYLEGRLVEAAEALRRGINCLQGNIPRSKVVEILREALHPLGKED